MNYKTTKTKTYKWKLLHIDDDEEEAKFFKTKGDAIWHMMCGSGWMISEE